VLLHHPQGVLTLRLLNLQIITIIKLNSIILPAHKYSNIGPPDCICSHQTIPHFINIYHHHHYHRLYSPGWALASSLIFISCIIKRTTAFIELYRSQYSEGPATGHLDTGFSCFPCVYKQMLRWFPRFQVATTCFLCSPPNLNLVVTNTCKITTATG